jgi:hypothetical protein
MKTISILVLIPLCFLFSCKHKASETNFSKYLVLKKKAITSTIKVDTTLLQFRFGMSKAEVKLKILLLENDSVVYYDFANKMYCYDIHTGRKGIDHINCYLIPQFHNNELYSVILQAKSNSDNVANRPGLAIQLMKTVVRGKYGMPSISFKLSDNIEATYIWFQNNIEISVYDNIEGPIIEYKDLLREKLKADLEDSKEKQASTKTQAEL